MQIDFADVKRRVTLAMACRMLGFRFPEIADEQDDGRGYIFVKKIVEKDEETYTQYRGPCPHCKQGGPRVLAITPSKQGFTCFATKGKDGKHPRGDVIALVAHCRGITFRQAAQELLDHYGLTNGQSHVSEATGNVVSVIEQVRQALDYDCEEVAALGLTPDQARKLGIGKNTRPRGSFRGRVVFPLFVDGKHVHYCAVQGAQFPNNLDV